MVVLEEARNVAQAMDLPPWWLNEQASAYVRIGMIRGHVRVLTTPGFA
ncbi:hypothetical protein [Actinoplanes sp. ATCC 53533]|nr:hypothetical protein [Actinoplanes sp. ATCC 53533]